MINEVSDEIIKLYDEVAKEVIEEIEKDLEDFGNPEKLLGKPYELWSPQDKMVLAQIYGTGDSPLERLVFRKEYEKMKQAEQEVG
jgi:hypothetical protein